MRPAWIFGAAALALAAPALAAPSVEIKGAAARVTVIPEPRADVKVQFVAANHALPLRVRTEGERVVIDGGLGRRIGGCTGMFGRTAVRVRGLGEIAYGDLPQIVVRTPLDARVGAGGAVFGSLGRAEAVELSNAGCGDWTIANVKGPLKINQAGSGDIRAGAAAELVVHVAGSGDISVRDVSGPSAIALAGSGDVTVASIDGPFKASVAGSGDVRVDHGRAAEMDVHLAGSGDVSFGGTAASLNAAIAGSGDVDVARVTGPVKKAVFGSGEVNIGR